MFKNYQFFTGILVCMMLIASIPVASAVGGVDIKAGEITFDNSSGGCNPDWIISDLKLMGEYGQIKYSVDLEINGVRVNEGNYDMPQVSLENQKDMWSADLSQYREYLKYGDNEIKVIFDANNEVSEIDETNNEVTFVYQYQECSTENICEFGHSGDIVADFRSSVLLNADSIELGTVAKDQHSFYGVKYGTLNASSDLVATYSVDSRKEFPVGLKVTDENGNYDSSDAAVIEFDPPVKLVNVHTFLPGFGEKEYSATMKSYDSEGELLGCVGPWGNRAMAIFGFASDKGISRVVIDYGNDVPEEIGRLVIDEMEQKLVDVGAGLQIPELATDNTVGATAELDDFYVPDGGVVYDYDQDRIFVNVCHDLADRVYPALNVGMKVHMDSVEYNLMNYISGAGMRRIDEQCNWVSSEPLSVIVKNDGAYALQNGKEFYFEVWVDEGNVVTEKDKKNNRRTEKLVYLEKDDYWFSQAFGENLYKDIDTLNGWENVWYVKPVAMMTWSGIFKGFPDGTFRPDDRITIAQVAKVVLSASSLIEPGVASVGDGDHWAVKYMELAREYNLFDGVDYDNSDSWNREATRKEAAKALVRAFRFSASVVKDGCYEDIKDEEICLAQSFGVLDDGGAEKTFNPERSVNRAEMATMLFRKIYEPF